MNPDLPRTLLTQLWNSCLSQEEWFPPLEHALKGIMAEQASWLPKEGPANSIYGIVQHLIFYKKRLLMEARGEQGAAGYPEVENNTATFEVHDSSEAAWTASREELYRLHREMSTILAAYKPEDLLRPLEDGSVMMENIRVLAMHDAYHIGQIVLLAKMQGAWPSTRSFN
ncbi:hypothetical protein B9G55_05010 [Saccharibacillus sp. O16]|nr:hypothetical protein B9G55_05010 [Saccharibacillus sp. O16]